MLLSGMALALHFSLWVEGIENTTITHALFFISVTPIIIAAGMWAFGLPISPGEACCTDSLWCRCPLSGDRRSHCAPPSTQRPLRWAHHFKTRSHMAAAGEIAGTCLGFIGGILLAAGGAQEGQVSGLHPAFPPAASAQSATPVLHSVRCAGCPQSQDAEANPSKWPLQLLCSFLGHWFQACIPPKTECL